MIVSIFLVIKKNFVVNQNNLRLMLKNLRKNYELILSNFLCENCFFKSFFKMYMSEVSYYGTMPQNQIDKWCFDETMYVPVDFDRHNALI